MNLNKADISKALIYGKRFLKEKGAEQYALDAEILMMMVTGFSKIQLFTRNNYVLSDNELEKFQFLLQERGNGVPTQYLTGECEFMSLPFFVNQDVLIPRPDTEILVETVLKYIDKRSIRTIIDVGTGTGCIPISLTYYSDVKAYAIDISKKAIAVAEKNARLNGVHNKIHFIESDIFQFVSKELYGKIDAVVSNPPYIPTDDITELMREVKDHEPSIALDGGKDGLDFYKEIIKEGKDVIKEKGYMFFEIGYNQGNDLRCIFEREGFENITIIKDLAGLDRVVYGRKK